MSLSRKDGGPAASFGLAGREDGLDMGVSVVDDGTPVGWDQRKRQGPGMRGLCWVRWEDSGHIDIVNRTREHRPVVVVMTTGVGLVQTNGLC